MKASYYPNQTADIKLEANIEYRFQLFWLLEGALFVDAGNIWSITSNDERVGALFEMDKFYKDIAVGTGFGTV
jgi:outer membrane protein assembly factor BamA